MENKMSSVVDGLNRLEFERLFVEVVVLCVVVTGD
jgi:hypothetical protein